MIIKVTAHNVFEGAKLKIGKCYKVEPLDEGTDAQNKAFHALLLEYFTSGYHSYNAKNFEHFRQLIKLHLGAGVEEYYRLTDLKGKPLTLPVEDFRIKSWKYYTKKERAQTIKNLISEMIQAGINSEKFNSILSGLKL